MLVELSKSQDVVAGDGTTSVTVLCGAMLKRSLELLERGVHPTVISDGFTKAAKKAVEVRGSGPGGPRAGGLWSVGLGRAAEAAEDSGFTSWGTCNGPRKGATRAVAMKSSGAWCLGDHHKPAKHAGI